MTPAPTGPLRRDLSKQGSRWLPSLLGLLLAACTAPRSQGQNCLFNGDCSGAQVCFAGYCRAACTSDRDCDTSAVCVRSDDPTRNACQRRCTRSDECDPNNLCFQGVCTVGCMSDLECARFGASSRCDPTQRACVLVPVVAPSDAGPEPPVDAQADASTDVPDAQAESAVDAPLDAADEVRADAPTEAALDVSSDTPSDSAPDVATDAVSDSAADAAVDAPEAAVSEQRSCVGTGAAGCGLVEVTGGTFRMGGDTQAVYSSGSSEAAFPQSVTVSNFAIDAYEVSVSRFYAYYVTAMHPAPASPIRYPGGRMLAWAGPVTAPATNTNCTWSATVPATSAQPINCVNWYTAQAFCVWDGGRLPTEAEWEYAARGWDFDGAGPIASGRALPWGDTVPTPGCATAVSTTCRFAGGTGCMGEDGFQTMRVGRFPPVGGLYDLAGNVAEWVADSYEAYSNLTCWTGLSPTLVNPLCTVAGSLSFRGGSYNTGSNAVRSASRNDNPAVTAGPTQGFRCARSRP